MADTNRTMLTQKLPNDYFRNYEIRNSEQIVQRFITGELPRNCMLHDIKSELGYKFPLGKSSGTKKTTKKQQQLQKKRKFLTRKERQQYDLLKLDKTKRWSYQSLHDIRQLWQQYMRDNLKLLHPIPDDIADTNWTNFNQIIARSEFIGAVVRIVRSKIPNQVGIEGTLVLETKMTFQLVTKDDKLKIIPKNTSVFEFILDNLKFTIFGKHLMMKPSERSVKKIKTQINPDL